MRKNDRTGNVSVQEMISLENELYEVRKAHGIHQDAWWQKLAGRLSDWAENRQKHEVNRKRYLALNLLLGWAGIHRFYEKRWGLGLFYLSLCWTGVPAAMAIVDFMIALPMKPDEKGYIFI